jgi:hypothetical protein
MQRAPLDYGRLPRHGLCTSSTVACGRRVREMRLKIMVATLVFGDVPYWRFSREINADYCSVHGYEFRVIPDGEIRDRSRVWLKVSGVRALLNEADVLLFMDADAYFVERTQPIETLLELMGSATVMLGTDRRDKSFAWSDRNANTGVFVIRRSELGFRILDEWWAAPKLYDSQWLWRQPPEQGAFNYLVRPLFPDSAIKVIPYHHLNGVDGEFIRHLIGMGDDERVRILEKAAAESRGQLSNSDSSRWRASAR